jgi:hypothetical protein
MAKIKTATEIFPWLVWTGVFAAIILANRRGCFMLNKNATELGAPWH